MVVSLICNNLRSHFNGRDNGGGIKKPKLGLSSPSSVAATAEGGQFNPILCFLCSLLFQFLLLALANLMAPLEEEPLPPFVSFVSFCSKPFCVRNIQTPAVGETPTGAVQTTALP